MDCEGLGILIDASVWVCWWDHEQNYGHLMDPIRENRLYIVICTELFIEYLRQMKKRNVNVTQGYLHEKLSTLGVTVEWTVPSSEILVAMNKKDQPHLNCAQNRERPAHLLISDDGHFFEIKDSCPLPIILTTSEFLDDVNLRERACVDAKAACIRIKTTGMKSVFSQ